MSHLQRAKGVLAERAAEPPGHDAGRGKSGRSGKSPAEADRVRLEAAMAAFDAELVRCRACGLERNPEIAVCPACHPPAWLPAGCLARTACPVLGPCGRTPCRVAP